MLSSKLIKSEPMIKQEIKQEPNIPQQQQQQPQQHLVHPKDLPVQSLGAYPGLYQRHPISLAQQHLSRDEDLRR